MVFDLLRMIVTAVVFSYVIPVLVSFLVSLWRPQTKSGGTQPAIVFPSDYAQGHPASLSSVSQDAGVAATNQPSSLSVACQPVSARHPVSQSNASSRPSPSLVDLPNEVLLIIVGKLATTKPRSWINLMLSCRRMARLGRDQTVWKRRALCKFHAPYWYERPAESAEVMYSFYENWKTVVWLLRCVRLDGVYITAEPSRLAWKNYFSNQTDYYLFCIRFFEDGSSWVNFVPSNTPEPPRVLNQHQGSLGEWRIDGDNVVLILEDFCFLLKHTDYGDLSIVESFPRTDEVGSRPPERLWTGCMNLARTMDKSHDHMTFYHEDEFDGNWTYYKNLSAIWGAG